MDGTRTVNHVLVFGRLGYPSPKRTLARINSRGCCVRQQESEPGQNIGLPLMIHGQYLSVDAHAAGIRPGGQFESWQAGEGLFERDLNTHRERGTLPVKPTTAEEKGA